MNLMLRFVMMFSMALAQVSGDDTHTELWLLYPVRQFGFGEGGSSETDLTMEPATPVTLTFAGDVSFILVNREISTFLQDRPDAPQTIRLERTEPGNFAYVSGEEGDSGTVEVWLRLDDNEDIIYGGERITYVMGEASQSFFLAPAGSPDPRPNDVQRCDGGPRIRLKIGGQTGTGFASGEVLFYESIDTSSAIRAFVNAVDVIAGPVCIGQIAWWQVSLHDDPESVGWTPEMLPYDGYLMYPLAGDETPSPVVCEGAPASRLSAGAFVTPADTSEASMLHSGPGSADVIASLPGEAFFKVQDGPVCYDGALWWMIEYDGERGWIAEGQGQNYVLTPSPVVILSDRLREIQQSRMG